MGREQNRTAPKPPPTATPRRVTESKALPSSVSYILTHPPLPPTTHPPTLQLLTINPSISFQLLLMSASAFFLCTLKKKSIFTFPCSAAGAPMFRPLLINGVRDTYTEALGDEWSDSSGEGVKYYIVCSHMHTVSVRSTGTHCCSDHHGILQPYCLNHANNGQDNRQTTNRQQADYRYTTGRQHCYTHTTTSEINVSYLMTYFLCHCDVCILVCCSGYCYLFSLAKATVVR